MPAQTSAPKHQKRKNSHKDKLLADLLSPSLPAQTSTPKRQKRKDLHKDKLLADLLNTSHSIPPPVPNASMHATSQTEKDLMRQLLDMSSSVSATHSSSSVKQTFNIDVGPDCPFRLGQQVSGQLTLDEINFNGFLKKVGDEFQLFHAKWLQRDPVSGHFMMWHLRPKTPNQPTNWNINVFENNHLLTFINVRTVDYSKYVDGVFKGISRKGLYIIEHEKNGLKWLYFRPELVTARHDFVFEVGDKVLYWNGNNWEKAEITNQNDDSTYDIQIQGKTFNDLGIKEEDLFLDLNLPKGPLTTMNESLKDIADEIRQLREAMSSMSPGDFRQELAQLKADLEREIRDNYSELYDRDQKSYHKLAKWIIRNFINHPRQRWQMVDYLSEELDKLNNLLKDGVITQEEFEKAKKKILDS